jgi:hypothetical protein
MVIVTGRKLIQEEVGDRIGVSLPSKNRILARWVPEFRSSQVTAQVSREELLKHLPACWERRSLSVQFDHDLPGFRHCQLGA